MCFTYQPGLHRGGSPHRSFRYILHFLIAFCAKEKGRLLACVQRLNFVIFVSEIVCNSFFAGPSIRTAHATLFFPLSLKSVYTHTHNLRQGCASTERKSSQGGGGDAPCFCLLCVRRKKPGDWSPCHQLGTKLQAKTWCAARTW